MIIVALLANRVPSDLAADLVLAGYKVTEALWTDEVLQLLETEHVDVVVIEHGVDDPEVAELQRRLMTLRLGPQATAKDVVCNSGYFVQTQEEIWLSRSRVSQSTSLQETRCCAVNF